MNEIDLQKAGRLRRRRVRTCIVSHCQAVFNDQRQKNITATGLFCLRSYQINQINTLILDGFNHF